ncbi:Pimeloyl-ACP methyl ester carboxylesterase [Duganella sp. CF458]|uniref:alpha/beta fold hydrolase n=1 Tax=Duganella sp. CF458 TaxID=1884368 RepID=UPI0008EB0559|nr:alpha/beta fold hydrolase [Duganella sp. CF458]SFF52159.1 Pimeloyl-ACP methyl ester carboxylesterase [Duganella sp. CF458]
MAPLVLIPGYMLDDALWDGMLPFLPPALALHFASLAEGDSIAAMAQAVLARCPPQFNLLGFSMGGYVAREIVRLAPERVLSLALVATSSRADLPLQVEQRSKAARATPLGAFRGLGRAAIAQSLHPDHCANEALLAQVRLMGERLGREVFVRQSLIVRDADTGRLSGIQCPTLVVAAAEDRLRSPEEARELADGIPGAKLVTVANAGHLIPLEQPQALAGLLPVIFR